MVKFRDFKTAVGSQFESMSSLELFVIDVDKDVLWETYLKSFPEGSNPIFRERTEYDCQCCKQFIRACGNMVAIVENKLVSIWDVQVGEHYQVVADALSKLVKSKDIKDVFFHREKKVGTNFNHQLIGGETIKWEHFYLELPKKFIMRDAGTVLSEKRSNKEVFKRSLEEISIDAVETVLELIEQNSIYRGAENKSIVELFLEHKNKYDVVDEKDNYCWLNSVLIGGAAKIRNTAIGTLLVDISEGKELDDAVRLFESKVAPTNYKRPTALITKAMINNAQKKVANLGIESALNRRYAVTEDITINNILFADRATKKTMNVFDELVKEAPEKLKNLKKVDEVDIELFVNDILPKAESIELMFENKHTNNLMSLIAPQNKDAKDIFKWGNNFSWAYNGEVADSIKERVKMAGGNINGVLRCSLSWFNFDDLDIHVKEPDGNHIYFSRRDGHRSSGALDVDMNAGSSTSRNAVENIVWTNKAKMQEGVYEVFIHQYQQRESIDVGFDVEIEFDGTIHTFHYNKRVSGNVQVAKFEFYRETGIKFIESLPSTQAAKEVWGITSQKFHKVSMIMNSPNHWNGNPVGNKHYFFMIEDCKNDKKARGFFNEFLKEDLREHRKVFEVLGSKMKAERADNQLSGLGFSSTQKNQVFCKVTGSFNRTIKINF
jgi:hypothetical protein